MPVPPASPSISHEIFERKLNQFPTPVFDPLLPDSNLTQDSIGRLSHQGKTTMMMHVANDAHNITHILASSSFPPMAILQRTMSAPVRMFGLTPQQASTYAKAINIPAQSLHRVTKIYRHAAAQEPEKSKEAVQAFKSEFDTLPSDHKQLLSISTGIDFNRLEWPS